MKKSFDVRNNKGPNMRSVAATVKSRTLTSHPGGGAFSQNLDVSVDSEISEHEMEQGNEPGIRYITESLIQKLSKQENLSFVKSLSLSLSKDGGKRFKFIESLERCERLELLNLSHNLIEKMEKLDKQTRLQELNLSHNRIRKIEGLEHMHSLQRLNLSANEIEHIPVWVGRKMKALSTLSLKQNKIFSLQDVSRLKPLKDLTTLSLSDNPVANLPHYRLYTVFHLRSLNTLDGQQITNQERQEAHERFNIEELEKLERELERRMKEIEELQSQKMKVLDELNYRDEVNKSLRQESLQQRKSYGELEREMDTKSEILKQKTLELTRACQKQYELEQELAFYKIDAKFEPLGYVTSEDVDTEDAPGESPYIGKARYKRNMYAQETFIGDRAQQPQVGKIDLDSDDQIKNQQIRARIHTSLDVDLTEKEKHIRAAEVKLSEVQQAIAEGERQILRATEELKELEEAAALRKISDAERERLRQQLSGKIHLLNELREEAQELQRQMDEQRREMDKKQREMEELQRHLDSLSPLDPRHSHVKAQKVSTEQQLAMMDRQYKQLEGRLDEMLSRIARETEEIKDLEQQLTDGQIAANEALKKDLEGIISGLQEYLESVKGQARQAHDECRELQSERELLLQRLEELEEEREKLEAAAQEADEMRKEMEELARDLQEQQDTNESLRQAQGDLREYEAQIEAQLKAREAEVGQLREELDKRKRLGQAETSALRAELERDKRTMENALNKAHFLEEKDKDARKLSSQLHQLQRENDALKEQLGNLQKQLDEALDTLVHPDQVTCRFSELKRKLQTGAGEMKCAGPSDVLGQNLAELQYQINAILNKAEEEKREAQARHRKLQGEIAALQERAREAPGDYKRACNKAAEAKIQSEKRQHEAKVRHLENEVRQLHEKLKTMEEIQGLADQQLVEADEERERLLAELHHLENERKVDDTHAQNQLSGLQKELNELKKAVVVSDKVAASELNDAKDKLRSLRGTVLLINQERTQEMEEAENFCAQAARAARDLAKMEAELELLQDKLHQREKQLQEEMQNADTGATILTSQQLEIDKLNQTLRRQRAEIDRLRHVLDHTRADNAGEMENLLEEIESLRRALGYQNDYISSMADPFQRKGYWYYVPSSSDNSTRDSPSTKDSGVSLHYPMTSSPARRTNHRGYGTKDWFMPSATGHWVYSPIRQAPHQCRNNKDVGVDRGTSGEADVSACHFVPPLGSVIYTVLPDGTPAPQGTVIYGPPPPSAGIPLSPGTVIYGPPPIGAQIVHGPPPPHFTIPVIPAGVLHCNVSTHHNMEHEISRLEDIIDHLKSRRHKETQTRGRLMADIEDLERQKDALRKDVEELCNSAQKLKRRNVMDGHIDSLITELELERSLQRHNNIDDEMECIEETLLKRRAELREADRLLAEAESELKSTQTKTVDLIEKYSAAKKHLSQTENDAEELERRAQNTAMNLVKADQQLRVLQASARDLEQHRAEQENILQEINRLVSAKDSEFQALNNKMEAMTDSLQQLQDDIHVAEGREERHLQTLRDAELLLGEKTETVERLTRQISVENEEMVQLDRLLGQRKEELRLLLDHIEQKKGDLKDVLREGEADVADRRQEIKEVKSMLDDLGAQLGDRRSQLALLTQEVMQEEDKLQKIVSQIRKQKSELRHVLEMQQLEANELQGLKRQHDEKMNDLERTQAVLLQGKLELENLQRLHGEEERQRQRLEKDHRDMELLMGQMQTLQGTVETLSGDKEHLERSNQDLERKLSHTRQTLADTEESNKMETDMLERLKSNVKDLQNDLNQLNKQKQSLRQETAVAEQTLREKSKEVNALKEDLTNTRDHLAAVEQDLGNATSHRDDLSQEQSSLTQNIREMAASYKLLQERESRKEERLTQLHRDIEERVRDLATHDTRLQQILTDIQIQEETLRGLEVRLEDHRKTYEWEVSKRQNNLDMISAKVFVLEERAVTLQQEERCSSALEERLAATRHLLSEREDQLRGKTSEILALQKETEIYKADVSSVREQLSSARKRDETRIAALKDSVTKQRLQFEQAAAEQKQENSNLRKKLIAVEQAAYDNHERSKRLLKDLRQLQTEHAMLQNQSQEELDRRQQEVNEAVRTLKAQVKLEIQTTLQDLHSAEDDETVEDLEAMLEQNQSVRSQLESLKEHFPFSANSAPQPPLQDSVGTTGGHLLDEQWRGEAMREQLRQHEDRLKAQLHQRMSTQAHVLSRGRQQTEGSFHSLRRQLDALDELVGNISADSQNSSGLLQSSHRELSRFLSQSVKGRVSPVPTLGVQPVGLQDPHLCPRSGC